MVDKDASMFVCFDLTDAFFHIRVAEESQHFLAFMAPQGKFVMACLGQGHHNSRDHLNLSSKCFLASISKSIKIIDDGLSQPETTSQAYEETWQVMIEAVKKNFKFSEEKIVIGPKAKFTRLDLATNPAGNITIKPDIKRVEALCNIQRPRNKKEVISLVGSMSTFDKWVPNLSLRDKPIR